MRKFLCLFWGTVLAILLSNAEIYSFFNHSNAAIASPRILTEYSIAPNVTDTTIDNWLKNHYVAINKAGRARKRLFVFFPGFDVFTPKLADGTPLFKDVWQYLCFSPSVYQR
ncbi:MAG TPA: hypothetical protein DCE56_16540 [Cyanobacteria bacterium UBA8553]|nr:hypothetical protein [Cyanobacteria bacterium UBA8553]HAJ59739.1 hypothetical protein [Cyanobacteria bacterium UBA8543]